MNEVTSGGVSIEYVCRVVDQTDGQEAVPESAEMAQNTLNGKTSTTGGTKAAKDASGSKTNVFMNQALQVATPVLNGLTDGVAGQMIGTGRQVVGVGKAIAAGTGMMPIVSALSPIIIGIVSKAVSSISAARAKNDSLAKSIDATNLRRSMAGLDVINYTRSGITRKVRIEEDR